jgi:hypothetical protein
MLASIEHYFRATEAFVGNKSRNRRHASLYLKGTGRNFIGFAWGLYKQDKIIDSAAHLSTNLIM